MQAETGGGLRPDRREHDRPWRLMDVLCNKIIRFLREEDGPTTVEYAMVILLVFLGLLTAVVSIGEATATSFEESGNAIEGAFRGAR